MSNVITQTIEQISKEKNIDSKVIIDALENAMVAASSKKLQDERGHQRPV